MSLSTSQVESAVRYNTSAARKIGWAGEFGRVAATLGPGVSMMSAPEFAKSLADWQVKEDGLTEDGKLGPGSWKRMKKLHKSAAAAVTLPEWLKPKGLSSVEPLVVGGTGPTWMHVAQSEKRMWDSEIAKMTKEQAKIAEFHMSRDEEYFLSSPYFGGEVQPRGSTPKNKLRRHWCAAFANHCLHRAGFSHTGSAGANSFAKSSLWHFDGCEEPERGCVIVFSNNTIGGHVAFLDDINGTPDKLKFDGSKRVSISKHKIKVLGGNQRGERITSSVMTSYSYMLTAVGRNGVRSPYMKPRRGPANCNLDPSTAHPHHCGKTHSA